MDDLISRKALMKYMRDYKWEFALNSDFSKAIEMVDVQPTVEAKEMVHGYVKTVVGKMGVMLQECSACGNVLEWKAYPNYCDECGAKLDGADMRTSAE